ncbi:hypothetical protein ACFSQQ_03620 [Mesorhizobium kowhaii]|uniref:hypothetical protein n=1 Tax=Mesorhizobium kowhaii TaxID=1300272 RepID=UPI0035EC94C3
MVAGTAWIMVSRVSALDAMGAALEERIERSGFGKRPCALQSGWLLANELARFDRRDRAARVVAGSRYSKVWNRQFATRIRTAAVLARIAALPQSTAVMKAFDLSRYGAPPDQLTDEIDSNLYEVAQVADSGQ